MRSLLLIGKATKNRHLPILGRVIPGAPLEPNARRLDSTYPFFRLTCDGEAYRRKSAERTSYISSTRPISMTLSDGMRKNELDR